MDKVDGLHNIYFDSEETTFACFDKKKHLWINEVLAILTQYGQLNIDLFFLSFFVRCTVYTVMFGIQRNKFLHMHPPIITTQIKVQNFSCTLVGSFPFSPRW